MVNPLKRIFAKPPTEPPGFSATSGGQRTTDPRRIYAAKDFFAPMPIGKRLDLYNALYESQPLCIGAVRTFVNLCNSRPVFKSGNPQVDARCRQIWSEVNGHVAMQQIMTAGLVNGFGVCEFSWNETGMTDLCVPYSQLIRFCPNEFGKVEYIQQLTGTLYSPGDARGLVPAIKFIRWIREPVSTFDYYGRSLFHGCEETIGWLTDVLSAEVKIIFRAGSPRFHFAIDNTNVSPEEFDRRLASVRKAFDQMSAGKGTELYSAPCEIRVIGGETLGVRVTEEVRCLLQNYLCAIGLPAPLMNLVTQPSNGAEAFVRQQVVTLQSMLDTLQDSIANAWNQTFWKVVQIIEGMPVTPVMDLENVRLAEALMEEQARQLKWANDKEEVVAGLRDPAWLATERGLDEPYDLDATKEYVGNARQSPQQMQDNMPETTKSSSTTKTTDVRASTSTTN